jgi:hypothetical protein
MRYWCLLLILQLGCSKESPVEYPASFMDTDLITRRFNDGYLNVKDFGAKGDGVTDETQAFAIAMRKADSVHKPLFIPVGKYKIRWQLSYDNLHIVGEKNPGEAFDHGTVIIGLVDCNYKKNIIIEGIGIDSRNQLGVKDDAALTSGVDAFNDDLNQTFRDLTVMGDGYQNYKHGILCFSGKKINIRKVTVLNFYHGVAVRSSNVTIDSVYAGFCGFTSVIVKSDLNMNALTENVSVDHVWIKGNPRDPYKRGGSVMINSYSASSITRNITVQNVLSLYGGAACVLVEQTNGKISEVAVKNCSAVSQGDNDNRACFDVYGGNNITFINCSAKQAKGIGYRVSGNATNIRVQQSYETASKKRPWQGPFTYLQLNDVEIIK